MQHEISTILGISEWNRVDLCLISNLDSVIKIHHLELKVQKYQLDAKVKFLAHRIRISEILPWDRKSYLTHAILPRTSSNVIM